MEKIVMLDGDFAIIATDAIFGMGYKCYKVWLAEYRGRTELAN